MVFFRLLEKITGKVHFYIFMGEFPVIEIKLHDKEIILDIKNPLLAAELALMELFEKKGKIKWIEKVKKIGYKIKIRHGSLEIEL